MSTYKKHCFKLLSSIIFINCLFCFGQNKIDELQLKTYDELFDLLKSESNFDAKCQIINAYIEKAKKEGNEKKMMIGYEDFTVMYRNEKRIMYADSLLRLSKPANDHYYTSVAYQMKGEFHYSKRNFTKALENFILAKKNGEKSGNKKLLFYNNLGIGTLKTFIEEHDGALEIHRQNYQLAKKHIKDNHTYLRSISEIACTFNDLKQTDSASYYNQLGIRESLKSNNELMHFYFTLNQGISHHIDQDYSKAITNLNKAIEFLKHRSPKWILSIAYFYLGQSHAMQKNETEAFICFKKIDSIFQETKFKYLTPEIKKAYEHLITYSKKRNDVKGELDYLNKIIHIDSISQTIDVSLNKKMMMEYDFPILLSEKENALNAMDLKTDRLNKTIYIMAAFVLLLVVILILKLLKRKDRKRKFGPISNTNDITAHQNKCSHEINIPQDIIDAILSGLNTFERDKKFTSQKVTLNVLAKELKTNTTYLSKIINHHKNTSFSNYLNTLRIEYAVDELKTNSTFRKFTIKSIAEEVGFNNSESFSKAFHKTKGIKPSCFLRELDEVTEEIH